MNSTASPQVADGPAVSGLLAWISAEFQYQEAGCVELVATAQVTEQGFEAGLSCVHNIRVD